MEEKVFFSNPSKNVLLPPASIPAENQFFEGEREEGRELIFQFHFSSSPPPPKKILDGCAQRFSLPPPLLPIFVLVGVDGLKKKRSD